MDFRNCRRCNKAFNYISGYPLCKDCKEIDEEEYRRTRDYVAENPGASIDEVSEACNISKEKILRYVKEERLEVCENSNAYIFCELCGHSVRTGRFCESCKERINKELKMENSKKLSESYYYNEQEEKKIRYFKNEFFRDKK